MSDARIKRRATLVAGARSELIGRVARGATAAMISLGAAGIASDTAEAGLPPDAAELGARLEHVRDAVEDTAVAPARAPLPRYLGRQVGTLLAQWNDWKNWKKWGDGGGTYPPKDSGKQ
jgi:hypothetical protein